MRPAVPLATLATLALLACSEPEHPPVLNGGNSNSPGGGTSQAEAGTTDAGVATLAAADHPRGLAVAGGYVYFTNYVTGAPGEGSVARVPGTGGAATIVASSLDGPWAVGATTSEVVFTTSPASGTGGVFSVSPQGGAVAVIEQNLTSAVAVALDATSAYWVDQSGGVVVERASLGGGTPVQLGAYGGVVDPAGLAVAEGDVYFSGSGPNGGVFHVVASGGVTDVLDVPQALPFAGVAVNAATVYVAVADDAPNGEILAYPRAGGVPTVLATGLDRPTSLALDGANLYFASPRSGTVYVVPVAGGTPRVVANGLTDPVALLVTDAIYVGVDDAILRIPK